MSERMIELHRARLLAAGKGNKSGSGIKMVPPLNQQNGSSSVPHHGYNNTPQTPQQIAVATMHAEDRQLKIFLQKLQHERDDSQQGEASLGPTVPTALSRRMLHRQGAGYFDGTVAAMTSAAADRFLATVLQQAVACRDQRLKGVEIARQSSRKRKRHKRQYQESVEDRRQRKEERAAYRESVNLAAIAAADELQQKPSLNRQGRNDSKVVDEAGVMSTSPPKSKKKKKVTDTQTVNGYKKRPSNLSDDEASFDSIDDEEKYYEQYYCDDDNSSDEFDEDEDDTMILRDLKRPLEAWDYHMNGKIDTVVANFEKDEDSDEASTDEVESDDDDIIEEGYTEAMSIDAMENGVSNDAVINNSKPAVSSKRSPSKSPDEKQHASRIDSQPASSSHGGATTL